MSVLVYVEYAQDHFKKTAFEAVTYASKIAQQLNTSCIALVLGKSNHLNELGDYGATKVLNSDATQFNSFDSQVFTNAIAKVAMEQNTSVIVLANSANGRSLTGRLSVKLNAGSVAGANKLPIVQGTSFIVGKSVFSGKAVANFEIKSPIKIISLMGNSIKPEKVSNNSTIESITLPETSSRIKVKEVKTVEGTVPLPEAEIVVSAGRGMKGPENWGIVEDLASSLGATTACSRPVADAHWRPHHEHVGQTGVAIRPNLYIAIGISGAIQHLAGVNNSKTIVVINKDPEAPFFKAADYGVVGDLFDVVPKLTAAIKDFKNNH